MLVNVASDISESKDLSQQYPEKVQALEAAWKQWNAELAEPPTEKSKPGNRVKKSKPRNRVTDPQ
jgi:hypothetical protein